MQLWATPRAIFAAGLLLACFQAGLVDDHSQGSIPIARGGPELVSPRNWIVPGHSANLQAVASRSDDAQPTAQRANLYTFYNLPVTMTLNADSMQKLFENTYMLLTTYGAITEKNQVEVEVKVFLPVRKYLRKKVGLPLERGVIVEDYANIAKLTPKALEQCRSVAHPNKPFYMAWMYNCIAAYVVDGSLIAMWNLLPEDFSVENRNHGLVAAALHSEVATFQFLLELDPALSLYPEGLIMGMHASRGDEIYSIIKRLKPAWVPDILHDVVMDDRVDRLQRFEEERERLDDETLEQLLDYAATKGLDAVFTYLASKLGGHAIPANSLLIAAENGRTELLKVIARNPENTQVYPLLTYSRMLISAVKNRHHETVRYLLTEMVDSGQRWPTIDPASQGNEAFRYACFNEDIEMWEILLANGPNGTPLFPNVDISAHENSVLVTAISIGSMSMVKYILEKSSLGKDHRFAKVNFSEPNNRPLEESVHKQKFEVFKFILDETRAGNPKFVNVNPLSIQSTVCGMSDTRFAMELYRLSNDGKGFLFPGLSVSHCQAAGGQKVITDFLERLNFASPP